MLRIGYFGDAAGDDGWLWPFGEPLDHNFVGKLDAISKR
jgi:hypothetical protein